MDDARVDGRLHGERAAAGALRRRRRDRARACAMRCCSSTASRWPVIARADALWARLSLQVYNDESDIERLAQAVESLA